MSYINISLETPIFSGSYKIENYILTECLWLIPVILATWEAKIRRIVVLYQPGQKFMRSHLNQWHGSMCLSSQLHRRLRSGDLRFQASLGKKRTISAEKSWAWWSVPVIPVTAGRVK
jgi:hypothetical protein